MRIAVLTTDTLHHAHFVRELAREQRDLHVFNEMRKIKAPFETAHPFENRRQAYERDLWFAGRDARIADFVQPRDIVSMNDTEAVGALRALKPDIVVVFGTGRLSVELIATCNEAIYNLHGGDPQEYRGLDSHLWAIYHRDFAGLKTTLHQLDSELDNGDIVAMSPIPLVRDMTLEQLRAANTEACLQLVRSMLNESAETGRISSSPQRRSGRYYSFMPTVLKDVCVRRFAQYTGSLT